MAIKYYPSSKIKPNQITRGEDFTDAYGNLYSGKYYSTHDGKYFSGPDPKIGPNKPIYPVKSYSKSPILNGKFPFDSDSLRKEFAKKSIYPIEGQFNVSNRVPGKPNAHYPRPTESDYKKGYITRYFTKKENEKGYITEISQSEYELMTNGMADFDISIYQTTKILWKLTGPLRSQRQSQYNIIPGIIDTNQRLTESANKTFLGIIEFIGGEYDKFARPTA